MKKTILAVILSFITFSMWADDSGNCGTNLSWNYVDETLTISGSGEMIDFQEDGNNCPWNKYKNNIFFVNIESGVTSIGNYAFSQCVQLTGINIPDGLTSIGEYAFKGCTELRWDQRCSTLKGIKIPNTVTSIGNYAFSGCKCLTSIELSNNIVAIKQGVFEYCKGLTAITIPNSVTRIGEYAFECCTGLSSVNIGNNVKEIGHGAFMDCSGMTSITIPNSVTSIGSKAFYDCDSMTSIVVEEGNSIYDSRDNCNAIIKTASNTLLIGCQNTNIPISVTSIGEDAFYDCSGLTSITIPNSVISIGKSAFFGCSGLTSITIPNNVTSIGEYAFGMCSGVTSITIPNSMTSIEKSTFSSCSSLTSINIPSSVLSIGGYAFDGCTSLTSVTIPNSVNSIGGYAFSDCKNLTSITIPESVTSIGTHAFSHCKSLTSISIPSSVTNIREQAFAYTAWLDNQPDGLVYAGNVAYVYKGTMPEKTSITIKSGTQSISNYAFNGYRNLTSINIPSSVLSIGSHAFDGTAWLDNQPDGLVYVGSIAYAYKGLMPINTSIIIKDGTISISEDAFRNYRTLTSITIPYSVTRIESDAFYGCTGLSSVNIGNNVKEIGDGAFCGCSSLTSISIPNSVTSIDNNAFRDCSGLTSVTIGNSVTSIGDAAFYRCSSLTSVHISDLEAWCRISFGGGYSNPLYYAHRLYMNGNEITNLVVPESVTSIGDYAFVGCSGLTTITIPNSVTNIGDYAFSGCSCLMDVFCYTDNVPSTPYNAFGYSSNINSTLHVPEVSIDLYKASEPWKNFKEIVKIDIYTLTYIIDNEVYKSFEIEEGENITPESAPTKEGYTFLGWNAIPETMPAHDVVITGSFKINKYLLTYKVDDEIVKSDSIVFNTAITPEADPTKEGYTFSGWSEIPETMPAHDVTVAGTFSINSYDLTYMIDEEVYKVVAYNYGVTITPEPQPQGDYASFEWLDLPETMPAHDVVVYASYISGIAEILMATQRNTRIYSPNGKKLDKPLKGLNIVIFNDGTVKKIVVK